MKILISSMMSSAEIMLSTDQFCIRPDEISIVLEGKNKQHTFKPKDIEMIMPLEKESFEELQIVLKEPEPTVYGLFVVVDVETAVKIFKRFRKYNLLKEEDNT